MCIFYIFSKDTLLKDSIHLSLSANKCPATQPYAYFDGVYCCIVNKEGNGGIDGCNGATLTPSSKCCFGEGAMDHMACPYTTCLSSPAGNVGICYSCC